MSIKNINEIDVIDRTLTESDKVLLTTPDGAKLYSAAGLASSGSGSGYDLQIILTGAEDSEEFERTILCDVKYSELKKKIEGDEENEIAPTGINVNAQLIMNYPDGNSGPSGIIGTTCVTGAGESEGNWGYYYGDSIQQYIGKDSVIFVTIGDHYTYNNNGERDMNNVFTTVYIAEGSDGYPTEISVGE